MTKKNVLILGKKPPPYMGTSVWFDTLSNSKLKNYFNITFYNVNIHTSLSSLGSFQIKSIFDNFIIYFNFLKFIFVKKFDLALIPISQTTLGFLKDSIFILIVQLFTNKTIIMLHGSNLKNWLSKSSSLTNKYFSFCMNCTNSAIVLGNNLKPLFNDYFNENEIFSVPNGLDISNKNIRDKHTNSIKILYLGNLQPTKGIIDVIYSIKELHAMTTKSFSLTVVGEWRDNRTKEICMEFKKKFNLPIKFLGPLYNNKKYDVLKQTDIFLFPPRNPEGHPLVIIEAMAYGIPIISTNQGAIIESVKDGYNGFIVPTNSPKEIAKKLELLIANKELRATMGARSRELYENKFTEQKMVENLTYIFNTVLNLI